MAGKHKLQIEEAEIEQENTPSKKLRRHYTIEFKLQIVSEAKQSYNRTVAAKYNISEKIIRDWRTNEDKLKNEQSSKNYRIS